MESCLLPGLRNPGVIRSLPEENIFPSLEKLTLSHDKVGLLVYASAFAEKGLAFISVPIFTRLLDVGDYGTVSFFQSLVGILAILSGLNLDASIGIAKQEKKDVFHVYVSSLFLFSLIWLIAEILLLSLWKTRVERTFGISITWLLCTSQGTKFHFNSIQVPFVENRYRLRSVLPFLRAAAEILVSVVLLLTILKGSFWGGLSALSAST